MDAQALLQRLDVNVRAAHLVAVRDDRVDELDERRVRVHLLIGGGGAARRTCATTASMLERSKLVDFMKTPTAITPMASRTQCIFFKVTHCGV